MVGSQAFNNAKAFNMNIGGWNTASVKTLSSVLAPLRPSRTSQPRNRSADAAVARRKQSRRRCGLYPRLMWAWPGARVGERWCQPGEDVSRSVAGNCVFGNIYIYKHN